MDRRQARAKGFLRGLADTLWPPRSLVSGQRGIGKGPLAPEEFGQIHFLTGAVCDTCGTPLGFDLGPGAVCAPCIARPPRWNRARAAMVYDAASRRPVLDLKRSGRRDGLATLSSWLAQEISRLSGTPVMVDAIKRTRRTPTQGGLSARARRRNVAGAFTITRRAAPRISGRRILLVDDVLTTGATVSACTRALKQAGAGNVDVLVLARVVRETDITI